MARKANSFSTNAFKDGDNVVAMDEANKITELFNKNLEKLSIKAEFAVIPAKSGNGWAVEFRKFGGTFGQWMLIGTVAQIKLQEMGISLIRVSGGPKY